MKPLPLFALTTLTLAAHAQQKILLQPEFEPKTEYYAVSQRSSATKITFDQGDTVRADTPTPAKDWDSEIVCMMKTGRLPKKGKLPFRVMFQSTQIPRPDPGVYHFAQARGKVGRYGQLTYESVSKAKGDTITYKSPMIHQFEDELGACVSTMILYPMDTGSWYVDTIQTSFPFRGTSVAATIIVTHTLTSITDDIARFDKDIDVIIDSKSIKLPFPVNGGGNGNGFTIYNWKYHYIQRDVTDYTYELHVNMLTMVMHLTTNVYTSSGSLVRPTDGNLNF